MSLNTSSKDSLLDRAYHLWEASEPDAIRETTKNLITVKLFHEMKQKNPWMRFVYSFFEFFYLGWLNKKVEKALSAYKFDLITSGKHESHLSLFTPKERWFFNEKLTGVLKNILVRPGNAFELSEKGARFNAKVKKYFNRRELMVGNSFLYQMGKKFPNFAPPINWLKILGKKNVERHCKETFENFEDETITLGLTHYLGQPFDKKKSVTRICSEITYYVAKEKVKKAYRTIRSYMPF